MPIQKSRELIFATVALFAAIFFCLSCCHIHREFLAKGDLIVKVVDYRTNLPIAGVKVVLLDLRTDSVTDSEGTCTLTAIPAKKCSLAVETIDSSYRSAYVTISIRPNAVTWHTFMLRLERPPLFGSGTLEGVIVDEVTRHPILGATVLLEGTLMGAFTDTLGFYRLRRIPAGEFEVSIQSSCYGRIRISRIVVVKDTVVHLDTSLVHLKDCDERGIE